MTTQEELDYTLEQLTDAIFHANDTMHDHYYEIEELIHDIECIWDVCENEDEFESEAGTLLQMADELLNS